MAHSSCFPFISWLPSLQRAWEFFPSEAVISILHSWRFSCQMGVFLLLHPHMSALNRFSGASMAARAQSTGYKGGNRIPALSCRGGHCQGRHASFRKMDLPPPQPPCFLPPPGEGYQLSRSPPPAPSCSALLPFPQMRALRKVSRTWNGLTRVKSWKTPEVSGEQGPRGVSQSRQKTGSAEHSPLWVNGAGHHLI